MMWHAPFGRTACGCGSRARDDWLSRDGIEGFGASWLPPWAVEEEVGGKYEAEVGIDGLL